VARSALDRAGELHSVMLGFLANRLEEDAPRVVGGHATDLLEGEDTLRVQLAEVLALAVQLDLALEELPVPLLEHVGALVELLIARDQAAFLARELGAAGAGFVLGLAKEANLVFLGLEDEVLLLGPGIGDD